MIPIEAGELISTPSGDGVENPDGLIPTLGAGVDDTPALLISTLGAGVVNWKPEFKNGAGVDKPKDPKLDI